MSGDDKLSNPPPQTIKPVYILLNNDGVGAKITHVVLQGPNYKEWAKGFRNGLGAKRKLGFIDGTLKKPSATSEDLEDWMTVNYTVIAWIFNTIEPTLRSTISYRETSVELWEDIRRRFSHGNGVKIYQLESEISDCKQKDGEIIMEYYGRLKKLWDDINDYDALPSCDCSGCPCGGRGAYTYPTTSSGNGVCGSRGQSTGPGVKQGKPRLECTHCNKPGHTEARCWQKHGYPDGRGPRSGSGTDAGGGSSSLKTNVVLGEQAMDANHIRLNGPYLEDEDW
ncbi:uncharacterized protein LOC141640739 [Silene latifolia]|uniref:uncharacterized protein LOC141640739 n=1 Tax=Silene latifolia TaxID=37657 RepID=UPI003D781823